MQLHNQASSGESAFLERWDYVTWRAHLAGIRNTLEAEQVTFWQDSTPLAFARATGFQDAVQWLESCGVTLPGIEVYLE